MSALELPVEESCSFCDYLSGARPYVFLWRETHVAVAVTREQRGIAHLLVLPTKHVTTILDLDDEMAGPVSQALRDAAATVDAAARRPGIAVWQNNGVAAGQAIPHLHFHVAGTLLSGGTDWGPVEKLSLDATREIAERLAPHVPRGAGSEREVL